MDFSYVAGFFDGEGCVRTQYKSYTLQITIVQSTKQDAVLFEIRDFLRTQGIKANLFVADTSNGRYAPIRTLSIGDSASLIKFFNGVMPHLIVKKEKAIKALEWARAKQSHKDDIAARLRRAVELYSAGRSGGFIRKSCRITHTQLKAHLARLGIHRRTISEAWVHRKVYYPTAGSL